MRNREERVKEGEIGGRAIEIEKGRVGEREKVHLAAGGDGVPNWRGPPEADEESWQRLIAMNNKGLAGSFYKEPFKSQLALTESSLSG